MEELKKSYKAKNGVIKETPEEALFLDVSHDIHVAVGAAEAEMLIRETITKYLKIKSSEKCEYVFVSSNDRSCSKCCLRNTAECGKYNCSGGYYILNNNGNEMVNEDPKEDYGKYYFRELQDGEILRDGDVFCIGNMLHRTNDVGKKVVRDDIYYRIEKKS